MFLVTKREVLQDVFGRGHAPGLVSGDLKSGMNVIGEGFETSLCKKGGGSRGYEFICFVNIIYIYIYGYWVVSGPHGTAFINCTCMFEDSYIYLPSTHIYQRHS